MISQQLNISFFIVRLCLILITNILLALPAHANGLSTTISNYLNQPNELESIESHLQLWLDGSNINGNNNLGLVSGQSIDTWIDLSGNNHHAVEVNADNMPIFNANSVLFDGNNDGLTLPSNIISNTDYTIIAVEKRTNLNKVNYFLGQIKNTDGHFESFNKVLHIGYRDSTTFTVAQYANDFNATLATSYLANISNSISDISNANQFSIYYNGQFINSGSGNNPGALSGDELLIGRSYDQYYSGHIMEVLIFNTTLNESQLSKINAYLAEKWDLNSIIDSDNDSIFNSQDLCPYDNDNFTSSPENDYDSDGCLDSTNDNDDDNDGFSDEIELTYGSSPINELDTPSIDLENTLNALNTSINISDINTKLTLWLDAKNTDFHSNSTMSNQGNMETWLDLSGKGNHAYAESNESTPLFTQSGIYFDGDNDGLKLNSNILSDTAYTIITVEKRSSINRVNKIIGQVRTSNSHLDSFNKALHYGYRNETELAIAQYANDFYVPISESSDPTSINTAISNANNNNQFKIYSNGQLIGSGNGNNPGHLKGSDILIGRSYDQYYHGHILEVLIFNDELNSDQITLINAYLSQKWNLLNKNDSDNDGTIDSNDAFWLDPTESLDTDTDGIGNNEDTDDDNDGYSDVDETLHCNENSDPLNNNSIPTDYDGDFICNERDEDDDNDNVNDNVDVFPLNSMEFIDTDGDGIGNTQDTDDDNDGYSDIDETLHCNENSDPLNNSSIPTDYDNDFICSALDSNEVMSGTGNSVETSNLLTFPNPMKRTEVNGSINYVLNQNAAINLHIYNMFGQKVHYSYYENGQNGGKINQNSIYLPPHVLNQFPAGIYIILISNNGKTLGKSKLVIVP